MGSLMQEVDVIANVAHVIQLAVAPVFLLTGVGSLLSVLVNRLARVVDRFRVLDVQLPTALELATTFIHKEMSVLSQRARLIHWAIGLSTGCALLVCVVIGTLFLSAMIGVDLSNVISILFILAMFALVSALLCFLYEIQLATSSIDVTPR
ncbi:DUF2721 domain-containing protein [Candidatus Thiothrix sp. Deng01]|uniref:DUF2721 domain-containing protein n=1 Tax=Candidatus Thiothrix phosphatis TaxID=3112415 RepID=A0ABU6D349_9GAMM|nr:DUF2721 domain-containing protein [Candidatus Thiothrix sp. Deng01]MEB4592777.1 DUF2721 domain-containing protein [Candidatus Thiothrix sp. Deng01]